MALMATIQTAAQAPPSRGLFETLKAYLDGWVCLLKTRLEIVSTEVKEEQQRLGEIIGLAFLALIAFALGVLLLTSFVVALFWEHHLIVLGGFTLLYLGLGIMAALITRKRIRAKPKLFATTLAELAKDHQQLSSDS
jgi:uncharacterized membrane protein YqjE